MTVRYVSYDIDTTKNDYTEMYDFLKKTGAEKLAESTYRFDTDDNLQEFRKKLLDHTHKGDTVILIFREWETKEIQHIKVR